MNNFSGADYIPQRDDPRLLSQLERIRSFMLWHNDWRSVQQISQVMGGKYPENSIQAQLRNLRKPEHGAYRVERRRRNGSALSEYRVLLPAQMEIGE